VSVGKAGVVRVKRLVIVLIAVWTVGVVVVSAASAAAVTEDVQWYTGSTSSSTLLVGSESISSTGSGELITDIGETPLVFKATGVECLECTISNEGGKAVGFGRRRFTGVTVVSPSTCSVPGGVVTSLRLRMEADYMIGSTTYVKITPASGTTFATITLTSGSGACPITGSYITTGSLFAKDNNATNVFAVTQSGVSSGAINKEAGGELKFGSKPAELNGTASFAFSGSRKGTAFATK
jgi:hypothetical protein